MSVTQVEEQVPDQVYASTGDKPLLLVKVGSKELIDGRYSWIPSHEDLKMIYNHLERLVGDRYQIFVYHNGVEVEVSKDDKETRLLEVSTFADILAEE